MAALWATLSCGILGFVPSAHAETAANAGGGTTSAKKAILVVSFGTTYADTRKATTDAVTGKIKASFPGYEVRQAFTSRIIVKKLAERDGLKIDTETQALDRLVAEGYAEVAIQPLHIEAGEEYDKLMKAVADYGKSFAKLVVGRPLLYYTGQGGEKPDDYKLAIQALRTQLPKLEASEAVALMGHGGLHPANAAYGVLQLKLRDVGLNSVYVFTVEGYPSLEDMSSALKKAKVKKVTLVPMMLVAGDHANNDMAGDDDESFKSRLAKSGFKVDAYIHGLGENPGIQDLYVQHLKDALEDKWTARGKDRPPIPVIE